MSPDAPALAALRARAGSEAASALEGLLRDGDEATLARINALSFAAERGLREDQAIAGLLHAAQLGLFEMSWNVLCPSCRGTLDANATLRSIRQAAYRCAFCALDAEAVLDETVEVSFTVSPRIRRIAAHDPSTLGFWDYHRQVFFGSALAMTAPGAPSGPFAAVVVEAADLQPGGRQAVSVDFGDEPLIVFDAVTHAAHFVSAEGPRTSERRDLGVTFAGQRGTVDRSTMAPGPLRLSLENRTRGRVLPGVFRAGPPLFALIADRRRYLTAKRLLSNQTFRDLHRTDTLDVDQRLRILSQAFLFTDLRGSTELYERVGDLAAYDMVRAHFHALAGIVADAGGAVVKTIGDSVMAVFPEPAQALSAALRMRDAMRRLNDERGAENLTLKVGVHAGPCLAVNLNERQDYFGQTVNVAARIQALAAPDRILLTGSVARDAACIGMLAARAPPAEPRDLAVRGVAGRVQAFELA